jgi:dTDP-4-dehydrorhamnose 3,5-epimerase-like enzyme
MKIEISELNNGGDARGFSFTLPLAALEALGHVAHMHLASTGPRVVRGNHYHSVLWLLTCSSETYDPSRVVARKVV